MTDRLKRLWTAVKGWRTVMLSVLLAVVGVLQTADWATIVPPRAVGPVMLAVAIAVAVLRVLTDTPLGTKPEKAP
jgi:hypothetical protein